MQSGLIEGQWWWQWLWGFSETTTTPVTSTVNTVSLKESTDKGHLLSGVSLSQTAVSTRSPARWITSATSFDVTGASHESTSPGQETVIYFSKEKVITELDLKTAEKISLWNQKKAGNGSCKIIRQK